MKKMKWNGFKNYHLGFESAAITSSLASMYLQHLIPTALHQQEFLRAHLPHVQGSGRPSGLEITTSGTN